MYGSFFHCIEFVLIAEIKLKLIAIANLHCCIQSVFYCINFLIDKIDLKLIAIADQHCASSSFFYCIVF